ncbi:MAG: VOC family protein [Chloroflexota bacterium]
MSGWGVVPTIRVPDMGRALDFYSQSLGFTVARGGPTDPNCVVTRGDARLMLEVAGGLFSAGYNEAIRNRLGSPSATALYMEAEDLDSLYAQVQEAGVEIVDPLADRPWGQAEFTVADPHGQWLTFWRASHDE